MLVDTRIGTLTLRNPYARVPWPIVLYAMLSILDLGFSLLAFGHGFKEANPLLVWYVENNGFLLMKLAITQTIVCMCFLLWKLRSVKNLIYAGNVAMTLLVFTHLTFLTHLIISLR